MAQGLAQAQAVKANRDAPIDLGRPPIVRDAPALSPAAHADEITLAVYEDLAAIEQDWRAFEAHADGTVFQNFDWLACWQRHIGVRDGTKPAIVVGRAAGHVLFILPLAVHASRLVRELVWLGSDLCDYNAPLIIAGFSERIGSAGFVPLWESIVAALRSHPRLTCDLINLTKMPKMIGAQANPMLALPVTTNPSGAYLTHLTGDWDTFYAAKRSSATRRRDRTKRKKLGELGEVKLVNPASDEETLAALDTLMAQKGRAFARMGVANLFARPGHAEFYRALVTDAATRHLVHISRLDVGATAAAINLGLTYRDCYYHLLASYDEGEVSRFGPGAAHLHDLMRVAIERGFSIFDFTIGDERYKRDWCDTELKLYDYVAATNWRGALTVAPVLAAKGLKRWIKQTPVLWSAATKVRALLGSLRRGRQAGAED
jgi:CelD/BcsL family acetyltransferase involved in cellulose biosynthesis